MKSSPTSSLNELEGAVRSYLERQYSGPAPRVLEGRQGDVGESLSAQQLQRLLEISRSMNRIHDREELLACVGDGLRELFDAENSFLILFDEDGGSRIFSSHVQGEFQGEHPVSETILDRARQAREPILIQDTSSQPDLRDRRSIKRYKIASVLCAPLRVNDKVIGVLQFDHRGAPHRFPRSDMRLLSLFADHAATALNNLQLIGWLNQALDEAKAAQKRIVQAERLSALGQMAAGIAHDFNNSLFVALGFCDVLLSKETCDRDVSAAVQRIRTCALDAANTVRRLQSFASGRQSDSRATNVELAPLAEEMIEFTRHKWCHEALKRGVSIRFETEFEANVVALGNATEIREILVNLIFNAVDAMEADGALTLSVGAEGERVIVSVADEGTGMEGELQERVFEPFFTTKGSRGSGFGLSTCWSLARRLGGEIEVDSTPGQGSLFRLWLPRYRSAPSVPASQVARGRAIARVLVIDDDPEVLRTVEALVRIVGHQSRGFTSPREALDRMQEGDYDAVITDFGMPGLSGAEVAKALQERFPSLPVVILTGWGSDVGLEQSFGANVAAVLAKPITLEALGACLGEVLTEG